MDGSAPLPRIVFDKVEKSYGTVRVLPPLDLDIDDGEFTVLVGPSGCGKSTTLRLIAGLEQLSGGEIFFDGKPIGHLEPKDRDIAMVFQDYALYPHMNIAKNMSFALRLARVPKRDIRETVQRVADMLNIGQLLDRKPAELSGGQRQRVAMGRALVRDASTFLFDEPLSNLDAKLRAKMRTELAEMRDRIDKNMIYVTHDQIEAMTLGDRIVVMNEGLVQQQGTPEQLFRNPVNTFVAGFIGTPTINFLDGTPVEEDGVLHLRGPGFDLVLDDAQAARLAGHRGAQVTAGIRPASFHEGMEAAGSVDVIVVVSEYLGSTSILVTRCGEAEVLVELSSATPIRGGTPMKLGIASQDILLFDPMTGGAL